MSRQPAGVSVLKRTIATVLFSTLGSTGGFRLDWVRLKSQIGIP